MSPSSSTSTSTSPTQPQPKSSLRTHLKTHLLASIPEQDVASQSHRAQHVILSQLPAWKAADRVSIYLSMPGGEARTEALVRAALGEGKVVFVPVLCRQLHEEMGGGEGSVKRAQEGGGDGAGSRHPGGSGASGGSAEAGGSGTADLELEQRPKKKRRKMRMEMLRLDSLQEFERLERDSWGIPSLSPASLAGRENARGGVGPEGRPSPSPPAEREGVEMRVERGGEKAEGENGVVDGPGLDLIVVPGVAFDREMARMGHGAGFYDGFLTRLVTEGRCKKPFLVGLCLAEQVLEPGRILMEEWDWRVDAVATGDGRLLTADAGT
ncbi:hypothetical protein KC332_g17246 [Hortaea werneckii]|uniref:5-formyltetrahydrofolate cyclo-ligase n=2 Tax=Hortaea werneckii TaxID=91943 RepID=A0A3M7IKZ1_HORWE|nr:hypothetical protein KC358_g18463 [Hortaea werneckii]OTA28005.1 hypothetical protein BTJ68_09595 [Hortaea werneckii EXF-2000]KAI6794685.1 hypothetical protein KC350_g17133 [Hortaea werneckii]KAI6894916.1 hypothetical protein KC348_g18365 [Hortaea werneckii]KAI6917656.1 hypothetical protein KC341_g18403 [Hortaea werneckii]